ncbi:MAG: hypothetical protein AAB407_03565 [Patescibacteria group bacterium]
MTGFWSVNHYYDGNKLLRRILARKDLKTGERLATEEEVLQYQEKLRKEFIGGFEDYN